MALLFLILGIASLTVSFYFYSRKEKTELISEELSKQKGDDFEEYMIQLLGKQQDIKLVGKVSDYHKNGISALENFEPDLKFKFKNTPFAVECKWRKSFGNGSITWAKDRQIRNYNEYQKNKKEKVYIALGVGGDVPVIYKTMEHFTRRKSKDYCASGKKLNPLIISVDFWLLLFLICFLLNKKILHRFDLINDFTCKKLF